MNIINKLIKEDIIDKEQLVLKRYKYIGLSKQESIFVSQLFKNKAIKKHIFSIQDLSNILGISNDASQILARTLVGSNSLKVVNNNEINFDFDYTIFKLLETYWSPSKDSSIEKKMIWVDETLNFDLNIENKKTMKNWINNGNWERVVLSVKKISLFKEVSWPLLLKAYESLGKSSDHVNEELKEIINVNWLEV